MDTDFARQYYEAARAEHWWFRGRKELVAMLLEMVPNQSGLVLDLGAGSESLFGSNIEVIKTDVVRPLGPLEAFVQASALHLPYRDASFAGAGAFDLIEHVQDAESLVIELIRVVEPGGYVLATVPAHQWLWSPHDERVEHVRRYEIESISALFEENDCRVIWCREFYGFLLVPALIRKVTGIATGMGDPPKILNELLAALSVRSVSRAIKLRSRVGLSIALAATVPH